MYSHSAHGFHVFILKFKFKDYISDLLFLHVELYFVNQRKSKNSAA